MSFSTQFQPIRARFADVLLAIKNQIIAKAVFSAGLVKIVAKDDPPTTSAPQLVYLRARRFMVIQDQNTSAGKLDTRLNRQLDIYLSNRVSLDPVNSDEIWLTAVGRSYY